MNKELKNRIEEHNKNVTAEFKKSSDGHIINISDLLDVKEKLINLLEDKQK